jgi:hypothetical protein
LLNYQRLKPRPGIFLCFRTSFFGLQNFKPRPEIFP